ncbi:uncharacterized protein PS065_017406 isoform 1-T1 [Dugong dugon]
MGPELGGGRAARSPPGSWQWADTEQKVADLGGHSLLSFCSTGDELLSGTSTVVILECPFISKGLMVTKLRMKFSGTRDSYHPRQATVPRPTALGSHQPMLPFGTHPFTGPTGGHGAPQH